MTGPIQEIGTGPDQEATIEDDDHDTHWMFYVFRIFKDNLHWSKTDTNIFVLEKPLENG